MVGRIKSGKVSRRFAATLSLCAALWFTPALAQTPPAASAPGLPAPAASADPSHPPTAADVCHALEQDAAENQLPVEFFARIIWQESRFHARAVSPRGAEGIAQFMPATANFRGLSDPFDPIAALREAASYLSDLRKQFGNLGLAAAGYNAGPGRVSAWLGGRGALPAETRNYVAIVTGWTADEWASSAPPKAAQTAIPQGVPCSELANLILAKPAAARRIAAAVPRWGLQLTSSLSERAAWAIYRRVEKRYGAVLGAYEPIILRGRLPGLGIAPRYMIRIAGNDRAALEKLCGKLISAGGACVVLSNAFPRAAAVN